MQRIFTGAHRKLASLSESAAKMARSAKERFLPAAKRAVSATVLGAVALAGVVASSSESSPEHTSTKAAAVTQASPASSVPEALLPPQASVHVQPHDMPQCTPAEKFMTLGNYDSHTGAGTFTDVARRVLQLEGMAHPSAPAINAKTKELLTKNHQTSASVKRLPPKFKVKY